MTTVKRGELKRVDEHLRFALPRLSKAHAKVRYHRDDPLHPHQLDLSEAQCSQIIVNLVNNAIEAIPPERLGEVRVRCRETEGRLSFEVCDNGDGIPEALLEEIFEPFFTTKRGRGGTGLGLASARSLVTKAGGALTVRSTSEGARFYVEIPLIEVRSR